MEAVGKLSFFNNKSQRALEATERLFFPNPLTKLTSGFTKGKKALLAFKISLFHITLPLFVCCRKQHNLPNHNQKKIDSSEAECLCIMYHIHCEFYRSQVALTDDVKSVKTAWKKIHTTTYRLKFSCDKRLKINDRDTTNK